MNNLIRSTPNLISVKLVDMHIDPTDVMALAPSLESLKRLEELVLSFNDFGHEGAKSLAPSLQKLKGLKELDLAGMAWLPWAPP